MNNLSSQHAFQMAKKLPIEDFFAIFSEFKTCLFRLECLPVYEVDEERVYVREFLNGSRAPSFDFMAGWRNFLESARSDGKTVSRVRIFSSPKSDYERFEAAWCYPGNISSGESIKEAPLSSILEITCIIPVVKDYWLVDNDRCFLMEYDQIGRFLGVSEVAEDWLKTYKEAAKILAKQSSKLII